MDFADLLQKTLNGLSIGSIYAIFALGYTLDFSILGIINFAHAAVFTLGAYVTYALLGGTVNANGLWANGSLAAFTGGQAVELLFAVAALLVRVGAGWVGVVMERLAFRPLLRLQ